MKDHEEHVINLGPHNLVLIRAEKGYIMCGLLNIDAAEKLGHAACMVTGVKTAEDARKAEVKACTSKARELGVREGMTGEQALKMLNSKDFHRSRRMFCIHDGEVLVAPLHTLMSHKEWFTSMGLEGEKTIESDVRGFADDRGLFFYRGKKFNTTREDEETLIKHLQEIQLKLNLPDDTQVHAGVKPTGETRYPPKKKLGTIGKLKQLYS